MKLHAPTIGAAVWKQPKIRGIRKAYPGENQEDRAKRKTLIRVLNNLEQTESKKIMDRE